MEEEAFLRRILQDPKDATPQLIYADWLEEQGDPIATQKAEYLRLALAENTITTSEQFQTTSLQHLAMDIDEQWLAIVSSLAIENCIGDHDGTIPLPQLRFRFRCHKKWNDLIPTEDIFIRDCASCQQSVYYCDSINMAQAHARLGHCVALSLAVVRKPEDLAPPTQRTAMDEDSYHTVGRLMGGALSYNLSESSSSISNEDVEPPAPGKSRFRRLWDSLLGRQGER